MQEVREYDLGMPGRNIVKQFAPDSYYHIYNRGVNKRKIFLDKEDYSVFLNLLKRYLSKKPEKDRFGRDGVVFYNEIELQAYCLMPNHFHLLIYVNEDPEAMTSLMRRICTTYTVYFNKKYKRVGHLFQDRYKASRILTESYLIHISRYIHLNPKDYKAWLYSSINYYIGNWKAEWVRPDKIYGLYEWGTYESFLDDYVGYKESLEEIKYELADSKNDQIKSLTD